MHAVILEFLKMFVYSCLSKQKPYWAYVTCCTIIDTKYMYVSVYVLSKNQSLDFTQYRAGFLQIEIESESRISKNPKRLHKKCYF